MKPIEESLRELSAKWHKASDEARNQAIGWTFEGCARELDALLAQAPADTPPVKDVVVNDGYGDYVEKMCVHEIPLNVHCPRCTMVDSRAVPPMEHSAAWKYLDEYFKGRWSGYQLKNLTDLLLTIEADAVAAERERCAKLCEQESVEYRESSQACRNSGNAHGESADFGAAVTALALAKAIRATGTPPKSVSLDLSTFQGDDELPAGTPEPPVGGTIGLDGDTRKCCNVLGCGNDWPCREHHIAALKEAK